MNIKIKSAGVTCLVGDDYDRVYAALKKELHDEDEQLFSERIPGHEYLQWELPGEGWMPLSEGDPLMAQEVRQELLKRKQSISHRFGRNQEMAERILSVPDDSYVYYKADTDGHLLIRLTAWGYRYPERVGGGGTTGVHTPKKDTVPVSIHVLYDNKPLPNKDLLINGFKRTTDAYGVYQVGELPIGYKFEIKVDSKQRIVDVQPEQGNIHIDCTSFASVEVRATLDDQPYAGAVASLSYWGHELQLTIDTNGYASVKLPKDPENGKCTISIGNDYQQQTLVQPITIFTFKIKTPKEKAQVEDSKDLDKPFDNAEDDKVQLSTEQEECKEEVKDNKLSRQEEVVKSQDEDIGEEKEIDLGKENEKQNEGSSSSQIVEDKKQRATSLIIEILATLFILLLVVITYLFCFGMLFG